MAICFVHVKKFCEVVKRERQRQDLLPGSDWLFLIERSTFAEYMEAAEELYFFHRLSISVGHSSSPTERAVEPNVLHRSSSSPMAWIIFQVTCLAF